MGTLPVANDLLSWGFAAITAGTVLWMGLQHGDGSGRLDTALRLVVVLLIATGAFAVGLKTARHTYPFDQTTQDAGLQAFLE